MATDGLAAQLVAAEVGLSVVFLAGAGLLIETFWKLQHIDLGFQPDHVLTFEISFPWGTNPKLIHHFYNEVLQRVQSLPGVTAAGTIRTPSPRPVQLLHRILDRGAAATGRWRQHCCREP